MSDAPESPAIDPEKRITIIIELPQAITSIGAVLGTLADLWPKTTIDSNHPDGWRITIEAEQ